MHTFHLNAESVINKVPRGGVEMCASAQSLHTKLIRASVRERVITHR